MTRLKVPVLFLAVLLSFTSLGICSKEEAFQNVQCLHSLLRKEVDLEEPCQDIPGDCEVPKRLAQLYSESPMGLKIAASYGKIEILSLEDLKNVSSVLLNLIPSEKFSNMNGKQLGTIIKRYSTDVSLLQKFAPVLKRPGMWSDFALQLQNVDLPFKSQCIIAEIYISQEKIHPFRFNETLHLGSPFMAFIPPYELYGNKLEVISLLYFLKIWNAETSDVSLWSRNPWFVKRTWTHLSIIQNFINKQLKNWGSGEIESYRFLLEGALPEELALLQSVTPTDKLLSVNWNTLQARALFTAVFSTEKLTGDHLAKVLPLVPKLSPVLLQRFSTNDTDLRLILGLPIENRKMSSVTARQAVELVIARAIVDGYLRDENVTSWGDEIVHVDQFVWAIPPHKLLHYKHYQLSKDILQVLDSHNLTPTQAFILTGGGSFINFRRPETILALKELLKAMPAQKLVKEGIGSLPQRVSSHILNYMPGGSLARSIAILQKVRASIGDRSTLEDMLTNPDPNQFFSLLVSREIIAVAPRITAVLNDLKLLGYNKKIARLPRDVLSVLMTYNRRRMTNGIGWTVESLLNSEASVALPGLTCEDINIIEPTDFIIIMEHYNRQLEEAGLGFPKDIQHCVLNSMFRYLHMKRYLQEVKYENLLDLLEPGEITAIGGYVFAGLQPSIMCSTINKKYILEAIGQLKLEELLVAVGKINLHLLPGLHIKEMGKNSETSRIGLYELIKMQNLFHFMQAADISRINTTAFRIFFESGGSKMFKTVCADSSSRKAWFRVLEESFGELHSWTPGVVALLGDFLLVVPSEKLHEVPSHSWLEAADTLTEHTSYHVVIDSLDGERKLLWHACRDLMKGEEEKRLYEMSVHSLVRQYLLATKKQLGTVLNADRLLSLNHNDPHNAHTGRHLSRVHIIKPSLGVEVLDIDKNNTTESMRRKREHSEYGSALRERLHRNENLTPSTAALVHSVESSTSVPSHQHEHSFKVTCLMVRAAGLSSQTILTPEDVETWTMSEVEDCLDLFAAMDLNVDVQKAIWMLIRKHSIKVQFSNLGKLLRAAEVEDVQALNANLDDAWSLNNLAALNQHVVDPVVWSAVAAKFFSMNSISSLSREAATETMVSMGSLFCYSQSFLNTLAKQTFAIFYASPVMGRLPYCPPTKCLQQILDHLIGVSPYGAPASWTADDVRSLGILIAGLKDDQWIQLINSPHNNPLGGLKPEAARCMPYEFFKKLSSHQLSSLPARTAAVISSSYATQLSEEQMSALREILSLELSDSVWRASFAERSAKSTFVLVIICAMSSLLTFLAFL